MLQLTFFIHAGAVPLQYNIHTQAAEQAALYPFRVLLNGGHAYEYI